jgi:hypothetical protein
MYYKKNKFNLRTLIVYLKFLFFFQELKYTICIFKKFKLYESRKAKKLTIMFDNMRFLLKIRILKF